MSIATNDRLRFEEHEALEAQREARSESERRVCPAPAEPRFTYRDVRDKSGRVRFWIYYDAETGERKAFRYGEWAAVAAWKRGQESRS